MVVEKPSFKVLKKLGAASILIGVFGVSPTLSEGILTTIRPNSVILLLFEFYGSIEFK